MRAGTERCLTVVLNLVWIAAAVILFATIASSESGPLQVECVPAQPASFFLDPILRADVSHPHCDKIDSP